MRARRFNPGTDPGGFDFGRWMEKDPMAAASGVLRDERKLRDLIVEALNSTRTPEIRKWLADNAGKGRRPDVRDRTVRLLAASDDPLVVLVRGLGAELAQREVRNQRRSGRRLDVGRRWIEAQQQWRGRSFYPDANSTLRV